MPRDLAFGHRLRWGKKGGAQKRSVLAQQENPQRAGLKTNYLLSVKDYQPNSLFKKKFDSIEIGPKKLG
jgi:hypothetical protein